MWDAFRDAQSTIILVHLRSVCWEHLGMQSASQIGMWDAFRDAQVHLIYRSEMSMHSRDAFWRLRVAWML